MQGARKAVKKDVMRAWSPDAMKLPYQTVIHAGCYEHSWTENVVIPESDNECGDRALWMCTCLDQ